VKFRFQQLARHGLWTLPAVFDGDLAEIMASVQSGHILGLPRTKIEVEIGNVIYSIEADAIGNPESTRLSANAQATSAMPRVA
jgi:hypothetical protein